jgi:ATP-dependent Clp protease ATP-binding subunit ClpC
LDEIEKAHPEVFNILLQVMEDGVLTDSRGRKVDFRNTLIIMTSNVGVKPINIESALGFRDSSDNPDDPKVYQRLKKEMLSEMKKMFRPEFINRIDETVVFQHLGRDNILQIADLYLKRVYRQCEDMGIELIINDNLKDVLVKEGYDPNMGARPLRRAVQSLIENPLSEEMLRGNLESGKKYVIDSQDGVITINEYLELVIPKVKKKKDKPLESVTDSI